MSKTDRLGGDVELLNAFVNTLDVEQDFDAISSPGDLGDWLGKHSLTPANVKLDEQDVAALQNFREAIRGLLLSHTGAPVNPAHVKVLKQTARDAVLVVEFDAAGRSALSPSGGGINQALGHLLAAVNNIQTTGVWERMKACPSATCHWAFYDRSRNKTRTWCDMAVCGNRAKARHHREKYKGDDAGK